jgi:predicted nucleotidyltransferase
MLPENLQNELVQKLRSAGKVRRVILFGSRARNTEKSDSDIDIIVVLDKKGMSGSYAEMQENRAIFSHALLDIRKRIPIDMAVYTSDEWDALVKIQSSFIRSIQKEGIVLA